MPNNIPDCKKQELSRFDSMSEEELRTFLRLDASKPEGEASDMEEVLYVMELLYVRRKERGESRDPYKAFEEFKKYYAPEGSFPDAAPVKAAIPFRWKRVAVIAAVLALLIGITVSAGASRFNLFETIAKWTKETFYTGEAGSDVQMEAEPNIVSMLPYAELQAQLLERDIRAHIVPAWIPDGYKLAKKYDFSLPEWNEYHVYHNRNEDEISFHIKEYFSSDPLYIERSSSLIEVYTIVGTDYFIFENNEQLQIAWVKNNLECWLYGDISLSEAKQMIDSIEKD